MGAFESASRALRTLSSHPVIFAVAAAFGLLKLPVETLRFLRISYVYGLLALLAFPFTPVLLAALYGVADAALDGDHRSDGDDHRSSGGDHVSNGGADDHRRREEGSWTAVLGDAWEGVRNGYLSLLVANVLYASLQHALLLVFTVLALAVLVVLLGGLFAVETLADGARAVLGALGLAGLLAVAAVALVYVVLRSAAFFVFQLYRPAAVVGGRGPIEALRESYRLVRRNPRSAAGFVLVRAFVFLVLLLPGLVALTALALVEGAIFETLAADQFMHVVLAGAVLVYVIGVVQLGFLGTYRVAFYRELAADARTGPTASPDAEGTDDAPAPAAGRRSAEATSAAPGAETPPDGGGHPSGDPFGSDAGDPFGFDADDSGSLDADDPFRSDADVPVGPGAGDSVGSDASDSVGSDANNPSGSDAGGRREDEESDPASGFVFDPHLESRDDADAGDGGEDENGNEDGDADKEGNDDEDVGDPESAG